MAEEQIKMTNANIWKIIHSYFNDNPNCLVAHHLESYNDFFKTGIYQIFKEKNPVRIQSNYDPEIGEYRNQCVLYLGGRDGKRLKFGKPVIHDGQRTHYMFPNEARLRNMTYSMTIHYDIEVEYIRLLRDGENPDIIAPPDLLDRLEGGDEDAADLADASNYKADIADATKEYIKNKTHMASLVADGGEGEAEPVAEPDYHGMIIGGARVDVGELKKTGKKKTRTMNAKMAKTTAAETAIIREETEKSMVAANIQRHTQVLENIYLGKFPIMVQSEFCILHGLDRNTRFGLGECRNDIGGYFIIDGKEKVVIPQEKFADNMLYIREYESDIENLAENVENAADIEEPYLYSAEIKSVSENASKPIRTLSVKMASPTKRLTGKNIVVNIPNVRKPVPLFIVFRALGILTDKQIIKTCLLDMDKYSGMIDLFIPSVHEAGGIMTQRAALKYIAILTKGKTTVHALEILCDYFLPHVGENNFVEKAYYLGYMTFRLLKVYLKIEEPTNRDNYKYKRIEPSGKLIYELFREYMTIYQKEIQQGFEQTLHANQGIYADDLSSLIQQNMRQVFSFRALDQGFKKAFKGNWGAYPHTKRIGVVQDLNRLSFLTALNHLRKTSLDIDESAKLVGPRVLHTSQWGYFDPIDTPDGANIGLHKHLAISTYITRGESRAPLVEWLREKAALKITTECAPETLANMTRVIVNGYWAGSVADPIQTVDRFKFWRRNALLPIFASVMFDIKQNTIYMYCDAGRLCRPIFYKDTDTGAFSFDRADLLKRIENDEFKWHELITGFNKKREEAHYDYKAFRFYEVEELYGDKERNPAKLDKFLKNKAVIDYIDTAECENALIAINADAFTGDKAQAKRYTHLEIHESLIMSVMCNLIAFPQNNPATRNSFSCGQSKQAVSMYHTNYQMRMDKSAVLLNSGTLPLVKTQYLEHICNDGNPYGENVIVAIMCYTGYNMEDSILVNEGALKRGLFRTTYFSTYETHEEADDRSRTVYANIENNIDKMVGLKPGYEYNHLDENGLIRENTPVTDKTILIGMSQSITGSPVWTDESKGPKKGQLGFVDRAFMTEGEEGQRIAKVRVREERTPALGDKMASRAGQKGTVGLIIKESDMPFTKDGLKPDLIINPHAIPSRMTIGQFVECLTGKVASQLGAFADATAFNNRGSKIGVFGEVLTKMGYHSSGEEVFYNGMTGQQIEANVFVGPTYYMRLKHMVKDKVNFRALGPRSALTRQTVGGRANDGGLRIGEMERDGVIAHGATAFLTDALMERGDKYYMAVCNKTGMIAVYNPSRNLFMSPMADGPLKYIGSFNGDGMQVENITRFGRSFSVVRIPYTMKLLIQELQAINVVMRIITEDNIGQLENMTFSKNVAKLSGFSDMRKLANDTRTKLGLDTASADVETTPVPALPENIENLKPRPNTPEPPNEIPETPSQLGGGGKCDTEGEALPLLSVRTDDQTGGNAEPSVQLFDKPIEEQDDYQVGGQVMIRGGASNTVYTVKSIGDKYLTIESANGGEDALKVVDRNEIYPAVAYRPELYSQVDPFLEQNLLANPSNLANPIHKQPFVPHETIQFNPVIVVGDHNIARPVQTGETTTETTTIPAGAITVKKADETTSVAASKDDSSKPAPSPSKKGGSSGGWMDFFTVKKADE